MQYNMYEYMYLYIICVALPPRIYLSSLDDNLKIWPKHQLEKSSWDCKYLTRLLLEGIHSI